MKYLILLLIIGFNLNAQQNILNNEKNNVIVENGILKSAYQIDISKYNFSINEIDTEINSITLEHLLCIATYECDIELITKLIEKGVDLNTKVCENDDAITFVAYCEENGVQLAKLMIENGAKINGMDQDNESLLSYAIGYDNIELVKYLIENGVDKNQKDSNENLGCYPIHACESLEMLILLESNGFNLNAVCDNGRNLLHFVARENYTDMAKYLVNNQLIDINKKDNNGETPLDYAKNFDNPEIEKIIKARS